MPPTVGLYLPPDRLTLARLSSVFAACGHLEVIPETLWAPGETFAPNAFFRLAADLSQKLAIPLVAHGVGFCTTTAHVADRTRQGRWLERLASTHRQLGFAWMTEHSGATSLAGENLTLPLAVPQTTHTRDVLRATLDALAEIVGTAGIENSVYYSLLDPPDTEPGFLTSALGGQHALLLDLHNLVALEENHGFPAEEWLAQAPLEAVIEIHIAGGASSEGLQPGRIFRVDSHDHAVPERVWALLDAVLPRVPALRAITLERLEGTVLPGDIAGIEVDLARAQAALERRQLGVPPRQSLHATPDWAPAADHEAFDAILAATYRAADPVATLGARLCEIPEGPVRSAALRALSDPDALRLTSVLVAQLRFSRLLSGSTAASSAFDADPAAFTARFRQWHRTVAPFSWDPRSEARSWEMLDSK